MKPNNMPDDLKAVIVRTFQNVYKISVNNLSKSNEIEKFQALDYLKSVCADVDKYFAYENVFSDWQKRTQEYMQINGGVVNMQFYWYMGHRGDDSDFWEWSRRNRVDTPADIVAKNVRNVFPKTAFYMGFRSFCALVENYLCYGNPEHPKHKELYVGDKRLWRMMQPFVSITESMASKNVFKRFMANMKFQRKIRGS